MSMRKWSREAATAFRSRSRAVIEVLTAVCLVLGCLLGTSQARLPAAQPPKQVVKLVFVHHSCGENWLNDSHGGLGKALA